MSFPRYPEYKDSGFEWLGDVPRYWVLKRLSHFFEERREKASDKDFAPLSVTKKGIVPRLETAAKSQDGENRKRVHSGDFVINSRSDRKGSAGLSPTDGTVSLICIVLRLTNIDPYFSHHLLRSTPFQEEFYRNGKGIVADLWSTGFQEMKNIVLAVPPREEQRKVAAFLDHETAKIDALIDEQKRLIELLKEKRQAVISHAVTKGLDPNVPMKDSGVEWLGEVPAHWQVVQFRRLIDNIEQGWSPQAASFPASQGEWGVIKLSAVHKGKFFPKENKAVPDETPVPDSAVTVKRGDLLLTRANTPELVGDVALVDETIDRLLLCDLCYRLRCNPHLASSKYLRLALLSDSLRSQIESYARGTSGSMVKISHNAIKEWRIPVPPLNEQKAISDRVERELEKIAEISKQIHKHVAFLSERRSALISAAVTGKIDVRDWQPPVSSVNAKESATEGAPA